MTTKLDGPGLPPFLLEPMFVERVWGTADLNPWYDHVAVGQPIGEVWLTGDDCKVATGALAGETLGSVFSKYSTQMLGTAAPSWAAAMSPLLMKVIFAKEKLSVQVHPDDRLAQKYGEPRGKTECWYVLAAEAGAAVACGLRDGASLDEIEKEIADQTLEKSLQTVPVSKGEMIYVSAGTVHAIWPGSVLLETQQNSDLTYRLYDYGRPRPLHVKKALEATRLETDAGKVTPVELEGRTILIERDYFCVERIEVDGVRTGASMVGSYEMARGSHAVPSYLFAAEGAGRVLPVAEGDFEGVDLPTRGIVAIPATSPAWKVVDTGGLRVIRITPRWPEKPVDGLL